MPQGGVGEGREINVIAKQLLRRDRFENLHQRAMRTERQLQRVSRFRRGELLGAQQRVGERRATQVEDRLQTGVAARSTRRVHAALRRMFADAPKKSRY